MVSESGYDPSLDYYCQTLGSSNVSHLQHQLHFIKYKLNIDCNPQNTSNILPLGQNQLCNNSFKENILKTTLKLTTHFLNLSHH